MKIKLRSIRSNLDLNPFLGIALRVDSAIRKEFHVIVSVEVETWYQGLASELKKMITGRFLTEVVF